MHQLLSVTKCETYTLMNYYQLRQFSKHLTSNLPHTTTHELLLIIK